MRSGIPRRWLRGNLLITVLVVLLAEAMFLYSYTRSYYGSVQQIMYRRFSSVTGQLKMYTGDTAPWQGFIHDGDDFGWAPGGTVCR